MEDIVQRKEVFDLIQNDMQSLAVANNLNSLEQIRNHFRLVDKEFEIGTVLTPTMKVKRQAAKVVFKDFIDEMYRESTDIAVQV